jgi:hypothetical protein
VRSAAVGTVAATAVTVGVQVIADDTETSVDDVVVDGPGGTELGAHGIPTWWSGRAPAP